MIHTFEVETKQKCEYNKADGGFIMKNISAAIISDIKKYLDSDLVSFMIHITQKVKIMIILCST